MPKHELTQDDCSQLRQLWIEVEVEQLMRSLRRDGGEVSGGWREQLVQNLVNCWDSDHRGGSTGQASASTEAIPESAGRWQREWRWRLRCRSFWHSHDGGSPLPPVGRA